MALSTAARNAVRQFYHQQSRQSPTLCEGSVAGLVLLYYLGSSTSSTSTTKVDGFDDDAGRCSCVNTSYNNKKSVRSNIFFVVDCEQQQQQQQSTASATTGSSVGISAPTPSWVRRNILTLVGIPLPLPRTILKNDPALTLTRRQIQKRQADEVKLRHFMQQFQINYQTNEKDSINKPDRAKLLRDSHNQITEFMYGKGVTAQMREDFLARYGCTGWTQQVLEAILSIAYTRGIVEIGAGHGQWARALNELYDKKQKQQQQQRKQTSSNNSNNNNNKQIRTFCLAYDDMSDLPLNTHVYNQYTKPFQKYFGNVQPYRQGVTLQSWVNRGRVLLMVYPPPDDNMAINILKEYVSISSTENNMLIYVGEPRGGANANHSFFDYLEQNQEWILLHIMDVKPTPGDKGYEKMYILQHKPKRQHD